MSEQQSKPQLVNWTQSEVDTRPVLLLMCPACSLSGYGARSRDIAYALIEQGNYNVKIWNTPWGGTPNTALNDQDPKHKLILDRILTQPQLDSKPQLFIQITVPTEFQPLGEFNIGITAGIETTLASAQWLEGCNKMDLILTSSTHSKNVLQNSTWTRKDGTVVKLTKPIEVLLEGVDLSTYYKTNQIHQSVNQQLANIKEKFCFLFVGHWLPGDIGEDRKNVAMLVHLFLTAFKDKATRNQPALILKTSMIDFSPIDKENLIKKLQHVYSTVTGNAAGFPNVYLLHGDLEDEEINSLYNHPKVKAHISLTKGEGYGRPLAEAGTSQKPIIAPNWSGHVDFLKHALTLPGTLTQVHPSASWDGVILREARWMTVNYGTVIACMRDVVDNYDKCLPMARKQAQTIKREFSIDNMRSDLSKLLKQYVPTQPKQVTLKLIENESN